MNIKPSQIALPAEMQEYAITRNNLAIQVADAGKRETAKVMLRRAIMTDPFKREHRLNLAVYLAMDGEIEEAEHIADGALKEGQSSEAWCIKGVVAQLVGDLEGEIACKRRAVDLDPGNGQKQFDLACAYLRQGDFKRGWPAYESRRLVQAPYTPPAVPLWQGQKAKHVFVYGEQGVGDKIQFARYLPLLKEKAERITFALDRDTAPLFSGYGDICDFEMPGASPHTDLDYQISICSLPLAFKTTLSTIPPDPNKMVVGETRGSLWAEGLKVGIIWAGNAAHANDLQRSMRFTDLMVLASERRNDVFALQVGPRSTDVSENRAQSIITDLSGLIEGNWSRTPTLIKALDLLVTVDTGIAHLAGSMGVPCFLMVSRFNDWRWLVDRKDSPWYPSIRIFRQQRIGDWKPVVAEVQKAIGDLHRQRLLASQPFGES